MTKEFLTIHYTPNRANKQDTDMPMQDLNAVKKRGIIIILGWAQQKGYKIMNKILSVLICALMIMALFAGCSSTVNNSPTTAPLSRLPISVDSIEEYHNFLLAARTYANSGIVPHSISNEDFSLNNAVRSRDFGDKERYYMPSWLPGRFVLNDISFNRNSVAFTFHIDGFDLSQSSVHEYLLNNRIIFSWFIGFPPPYAEGFLNHEIQALGLVPAVGVSGLYYYDFAAVCDLDVNLRRSYFWIQGGYVFRLSIPLWIIEEHGHPNDGFGRAGRATPLGDSIADLIMGSALAVELVDGVYYVPPTGIEIVAPGEEDMEIGESLDLTANVFADNATIDAVIWSSSDHDVAVVSQCGIVTRVGEGNATITARTLANNLTATFELHKTASGF